MKVQVEFKWIFIGFQYKLMPINYWSENKNTTCLLCKITTGVLTKAVVSCRWDSNIFKEYSLTEWFCPVWFWLSDPCTCTKWCQRTIRSSLLGIGQWHQCSLVNDTNAHIWVWIKLSTFVSLTSGQWHECTEFDWHSAICIGVIDQTALVSLTTP